MKTLQNILLASIPILLLAAGCGHRKEAQSVAELPWYSAMVDSTVLIRYERTPCFGACPHFEFVLYSTGFATYNGRNFVERKGQHKGSIDVTRYAEVLQVADSIGFAGFDDIYDNKMVTDLPSITTELLLKGGSKRVMNRYQGPKSLNSLYLVLDRLMDDVQWSEVQSNQ